MRRVKRRAGARSLISLVLIGAAATGALLKAESASAFDFFGLFGSDSVPAPSPETLPYQMDFAVEGEDSVKGSLRDSSNLYKLRQDPPQDGEALAQRLNADFAPMLDALWSAGYYNARIFAAVGGTRFELPVGADQFASAADVYRNRAAVPITITAQTGPLFRLRNVAVVDASTGAPFPPEILPPRILKLKPGDPAAAADLRAANARLIDFFRAQSHPLVTAPLPHPTVNHVLLTMDVTYAVDPGPTAGFGAVSINGPGGFDPAIVNSFVYLQQGQPYTPKAIADTRRAISSIPAVGSVRIREGERLDANGNLPIFIDVGDRPNNLIGFTAGYSTVDGPTGSLYYENRNLFGAAESLRLQGDVFYAPPIYGITANSYNSFHGVQNFDSAGLGGRVALSFMKPALYGSRADFLLDGMAEENRSGGGSFGGYVDQLAGGTAALRYRIDETLSAQAGVKFEKGDATDALGRVNYTLLGIPLGLRYDGTDKLLDPSQGFRVTALATPYPSFFGESGFTRASLTGSAYYAIDDDAQYIIAARAGFGSIFGNSGGLPGIPANYRFYEGGLATIRGFRYQTVGPSTPLGYTIGGLSAFNATLEARIKVTDTIGVAPFFDVGGAFRGSLPFGSSGDTRMSAGVGLIYYTPIGPLRVDVARPLDPRPDDYPVVFYVSIGQPF
ncbi:translocation and assembly module TamA [Methylocapsa palsarum]|uniref:Translocation and assembly module TamA n=1 Tax=Methylocapsa palsarum TaxID=1612308 RepID=A0A1I3ZBK1_9HYPH|nr:translocation and assembly module TamA [Methylocapsa palsarum]